MHKQTTVIKQKDIVRKWYVVDASQMPLGRLASHVARVLTGKHKPTYSPNLDTGDFVVIVNAEKAVMTGNKLNTKTYYTQVSQQPGGLRSRTAKVMKQNYPVEMVVHAVHGMVPKGPLGRQMMRKLHVYVGSEHPHAGQSPEVLVLGGKN